MLKKLALGLALCGALLAGAGSAGAQQGRQLAPVDPSAGFGVGEGAMQPAEAAAQVELAAKALSQIAPQRPGVVDAYVLSVSFYNDPVFEKEASEAAAILGRRYDAAERTIILSAGRGANVARTYASASPNNFNAALGKIAATMDLNEDLLVLFMTSHGSQDGTVAIMEKGRMQGGLRPLQLRLALQQAGIRNKVVIVSACFSGNFIPPFISDPGATILTAAAADKTSFGCEPSRDWTFFGDALFNHAMRGGQGLNEAYRDALTLISGWEADLHKQWEAMPPAQKKNSPEPEPSNPQNNLGDNVIPLVEKAEAYGLAVNCAGHLGFALDRARSGRPLKGLADMQVIQTSKAAVDARAMSEGATRKRSSQDVAKAIAVTSASTAQLFSAQPADVTSRAARCAAPPTD
ncbi:MAG: C13 family peptidase [Hyphomonadaceae bacterium]|nr:C13 family peptidase [Hyphomonadaceae bacterium]